MHRNTHTNNTHIYADTHMHICKYVNTLGMLRICEYLPHKTYIGAQTKYCECECELWVSGKHGGVVIVR